MVGTIIPQAAAMENLENKYIALIDDQAHYRLFGRNVLERAGATVDDMPRDQIWTLEENQDRTPDRSLVIFASDCLNPQALAQLSEIKEKGYAILVLMPTFSARDMSLAFRDGGATDAAEKPLDAQSLLETVADTFRAMKRQLTFE